MKKMLALFVGTSLLLSLLAACSSGESETSGSSSSDEAGGTETTVLKLGHNSNAESMYNQGCEKFAELVNEYTDGTVTVEIHTSGTLGDEAELLDGVRMGTVEMALINSSQLATYCSEFSVLSLPFLFEDYDHVEAVVNDEEISEILATDALENGNVQLLMPFWADGFRHFVNAKHEVVVPSDMAGLKMRVPAWEALVAATEEFGAAALTMPFGEAYSGVSSGTVDGMEGTSWSLLANGLADVCDYLSLTGHVYSPSVLIINVDTYNDELSDEQVEAITLAAEEAGTWQTNLVKESEQTDLEELAASGMTVTEVDKSVWEEAAQPVYEMFADSYDQNLISLIQGLK